VNAAGEPQQLQTLWNQQLDAALRAEPKVVLQAGQKMLALGGDVALVLTWLWPIWVQCIASSDASAANHTDTTVRVRLAQLLQHSLAQTAHTPEAQQWLTRIEQAQIRHPADPLLQYLAGVVCMHLQLWGKAQQLLKQALPRLSDTTLKRTAWLALARLAEQRNDTTEANQAWRQAALL
jgi:HemY protein